MKNFFKPFARYAVIALAIAVALPVFAQNNPPSSPPPGGNIFPPVNISAVTQTKIGGLKSDSFLAAPKGIFRDPCTTCNYNPLGYTNIFEARNTSSGKGVTVNLGGDLFIKDGNPLVAGKVLTLMDATGKATWQTPGTGTTPSPSSLPTGTVDEETMVWSVQLQRWLLSSALRGGKDGGNGGARIFGNGGVLQLIGTSHSFLEFKNTPTQANPNGTRAGYVGFGNSATNDLLIANERINLSFGAPQIRLRAWNTIVDGVFSYPNGAGDGKILSSVNGANGNAEWKTKEELGLVPSTAPSFFLVEKSSGSNKIEDGVLQCPSSHPIALSVSGSCNASGSTGVSPIGAMVITSIDPGKARFECANTNSSVSNARLVCMSSDSSAAPGNNLSWKPVTLSPGSVNQTCTAWLAAGGQSSMGGTAPRVMPGAKNDKCVYQLGWDTASNPRWTNNGTLYADLSASNPGADPLAQGLGTTIYRPVASGSPMYYGGGARTETYR